jgi:hypothetical protein
MFSHGLVSTDVGGVLDIEPITEAPVLLAIADDPIGDILGYARSQDGATAFWAPDWQGIRNLCVPHLTSRP